MFTKSGRRDCPKISEINDTDDIVSNIEKVNHVMIRILFAGTNKSHICQKMVDNGYTVLVVCPTNRLLLSYYYYTNLKVMP